MYTTASVLFPTGNLALIENAQCLILLCQDRDDTYVIAWGPRNALQKLLVWGSKNWFILPPGEGYFRAVAEILEPNIAANDATPLELTSPLCFQRTRESEGRSQADAGGMECKVARRDRSIRLLGISDALLFGIDEHGVMLRATGGSGIQKQFLLEAGIEALFGAYAAHQFGEMTFGLAPQGTRRLVEGMARQMRDRPDDPFVISPATADELDKGPGKN